MLIDQLGGTPLYNSTTDGSAYQYSQCFYCVGMGEFGNRVVLANGGGPLSDVVVALANFNTESGPSNPMDITMKIFAAGTGDTPGALIASDEQAFNIPSAPDGGYGGTTCTNARVTDPNSDCGIANFNETFNFASKNVTLPGTIVYEIQFNDPQNAIDGGVNVQLAQESTEVSVGSDADPGNLFLALASTANGDGYTATGQDVAPGEVTCSTGSTTFTEYDTTTTCDGGAHGYGLPSYVPAVEIDTTTMGDLYPGGPSQTINFSMTNTGTIPETVNSVSIGVAEDTNGLVEATPGDPSSDVAGCYASWFTVNSSPVSVNTSIPAGGVVDWLNTASISMPQSPSDQNACQGATIGLTFTSD